jgi:OPT family small oligopeptide transporter
MSFVDKGEEVVLPEYTFRRRHVPDVPEDIDDMEHFNDPNYDLKSVRSFATESSDYELEKKERTKSIGDDSVNYTTSSEFDNESQLGTTTRAESNAALRDIDYNDESPYPEVRAAVSSHDDPNMPVNTFRMWVIGLFYTVLISGLNQFFAFRYPSVFLSGIVAQLTALPLGKAFEFALPRRRFNTFGFVWSLNPGPFNIKEHTCITVMANLVIMGAYSTDIVATQRVFYNENWGFGYAILLTLSSQIIGYSLSGLVRQFLVWPSSMIWPGALVNAALFNTLHKNFGKRDRGHITRERFFVIAAACSFIWYWVPGFLWTGLSVFNWVCWAAPNNVVVNQLFGSVSGLGMGLLTFDWSQIAYIGSPLVQPWWAEANTFISFVLWFWVITPILYYKNVWFSKFMPISAYATFDRFGAEYDPTQILVNGTFDQALYEGYSPLYMPTSFALSYGLSFASFTAVIVHTFLWYRRDLIRQARRSVKDEKDVHSRLMSVYPEVPHYWYGILFVIAFVLGIGAIEGYNTQLPVWAFCLAIVLSAIFVVPCGIIQAITNQQVPLNVIVELVGGYILPGRPVAVMIFKAYGYLVSNQAILFAGDLKLGHYMKVPPRTMFAVQSVATVVSCFVCLGVQSWMFSNIPDFCSPDQPNNFICPSTTTFAQASIIWGAIGPQRMFGPGALYSSLMWFFLIGAISPIPFYFLARRWPHAMWRYVNMPVFFNGPTAMPPATGINFSSWFTVAFIFQWFVRRFHFRWWMRYNYILSAALDSGVAIGIVIVFFTVVYPKGGVTLSWWGNDVWMKTLDASGVAFNTIDPDAGFGLASWH